MADPMMNRLINKKQSEAPSSKANLAEFGTIAKQTDEMTTRKIPIVFLENLKCMTNSFSLKGYRLVIHESIGLAS